MDGDRLSVVEGISYVAATGFLPSAVKSGSDLSVDNLDVEGFLDDDALKAADLTAGLFDGARIEVFLVNWADLGQGKLILRKGWLGEIKRADQRFSAEIRGLANLLQQTHGKLYSRLCRVDLGASECTVNLAPLTDDVTVDQVVAADQIVITTGRPSGFFTFGKATFLTGANAGALNEVLLHDQQTIRLFVPMSRPIGVGDTVRLVAGCDKTTETCHAKFDNILNFRGEPHIPANDKVFSYPVR